MPKRPVVIGVDLGGTKLLAAVIDSDGNVIDSKKVTSPKSNSDEIVARIVTVIETLRTKHAETGVEISAIGLGVPGVVDRETGTVIAAPNLPLEGVELGRLITGACGLPTEVGNDVTLATMGEVWFGAARGVGNVLGVFVGTGIGAGVVVDGKMYLGAHGGSGESGHVLMQRDGPECGCGRRGCLEALASRTAIERDIRLEVEDGRMSVLGDRVRAGKRLRSGRILTALEEGDSLTTEIVNRASSTLGTAIGSVVNVLDPDLVVVGGGLVEACGLFMMPVVIEAANARMMPVPGGPVPIVPSQLGDNAGILGAAALAFEALNVRKPGGATAYAPVVEWVADSEVIVNGERRVDDFFIRADGKVRKRKRRLSRAELGTDRGLSAAEAQFVCQGRPSVLIVGAGERGQLQISNDARSWLESQGIRLVNAPTRAAITEYRVRKGPRALLLYLRDS